MKNVKRKRLCSAICLLIAFVLWTVAVKIVDVQAIGPRQSTVGFSTVNGFIHKFIGVNMNLYEITDWLGLVPIGVAMGFAILGLCQLIKRKSLFKVDCDVLVLGVFYIVVFTAYILFEMIVINYRPVLINGYLEPSYPSSTTMLVLSVIPTAIIQFKCRIKNRVLGRCVNGLSIAFIVFMVVGRLVSGVHWFSDIVGGCLLSLGLVFLYEFFVGLTKRNKT